MPDDVFLIAKKKVEDDFQARKSCFSRTYRFYFLGEKLDIEKMQKAAKLFEGKIDLRNFCKMKDDYREFGTKRTIFKCEVKTTENNQMDDNFKEMGFGMFWLECEATGFLWHQVLSKDAKNDERA